MTPEQIEKCDLIFGQYGSQNQILKTIEELMELGHALVKWQMKDQHNLSDRDQVCHEIADVLIMCEQMKLFFGQDEVHVAINKKLRRQIERMETSPVLQDQHKNKHKVNLWLD